MFGAKIVAACKSALFNNLDLVWYLLEFFNSEHAYVEQSWIWGRVAMLAEEKFLRDFPLLDLHCGVRRG